MSFANYDLEAQTPAPQPKAASLSDGDSAELNAIMEKTSQQMQTYGSLITSLANERRSIGTRRDSVELRDKLDSECKNIASLGAAVQKLISDINLVMNTTASGNQLIAVSNRQLMMKERLAAEYSELRSNFETQLKLYREMAGRTPVPARKTAPEVASGQTESSPLLQNGSQSQYPIQTQMEQDLIEQNELQYHTMLTEERNRQIEQVSEGIREINSIFKDLGELVNQQGAQLDTVEDNILQVSGNTHQASQELTKAHEYQKRRGKWSCILLVALCVVTLVIVLAVVS